MQYKAFLCLLVVSAAIGYALGRSLTFAGSVGIRSVAVQPHTSMRRGLSLFRDQAIAKGLFPFTVHNVTFDTLDLRFLEDNGNTTTIRSNYRALLNDSSVDYLFAPWGNAAPTTDWTNFAADLTEPAGRLLLSASATDRKFYSLPRELTFSTTPPLFRLLYTAVPSLRVAGAKTAVIMKASSLFEMCGADLIRTLRRNGITVLGEYIINDGGNSPASVPLAELPEVVRTNLTETTRKAVREHGSAADVYIWCNSKQRQGRLPLHVMREEFDFTPKAFLLVAGRTWFTWEEYPEVAGYVLGHTTFDPEVKYEGDPTYDPFGTTAEFNRLYQAAFNATPDQWSALSAVMGMGLYRAVRQGKSLSDQDIASFISRTVLTTFAGEFSWNTEHAQLAETVIFQANPRTQTMEIVAPLETAQTTLVYPMPTWKERIFNPVFGDPVEIVMLVLAVIGILTSLAWAVFTFMNWENKTIVAGSRVFLLVILFGSILLYSSVFTWFPNVVTDSACVLRYWTIVWGFVILFGSMFAKTWRIYRLYTDDSMSVIRITDTQVAMIIGCILLAETIPLVLISALGNYPLARIVTVDPVRPAFDYYACTANTAQVVLTWIIVGLNVILFGFGAFLGFMVRTIPRYVYDESKIIGFSIYNAGFFSILGVILEAATVTSRFPLFGIRSICIILGTFITITTLFTHKWQFLKNPEATRSSGRTTIRSGASGSKSSDASSNGGSVKTGSSKSPGSSKMSKTKVTSTPKESTREESSIKAPSSSSSTSSDSDDASNSE